MAEAIDEGVGAETGGGVVPSDGAARLPGLWIICVSLGLLGMVHVALVFLAKPLGVAVFGVIALVCLASAVGLWVRSNGARIAVTAWLAMACCWLLMDCALHPFEAGKVVNAIPFGVGLAFITYLVFRRRCFTAPPAENPLTWTWGRAAEKSR